MRSTWLPISWRALAGLGGFAGLAIVPFAHADFICPTSGAGWQAYVDQAAHAVETMGLAADDLGYRPWRGEIDSCGEQTPIISACLANLRDYSEGRRPPPKGHALGLTISDDEYVQRQIAQDPGGMFELPPELLMAWPDISRVHTLCDEKKWACLSLPSVVPADLVASGERLLIRIKASRFDQWVIAGQGLPDPNAYDRRNVLKPSPDSPSWKTPILDDVIAMIAVQTADIQGIKLDRPRVQFRDWTQNPESHHLQIGSQSNCYSCHVSPLNRLEYRAGPFSEPSGQREIRLALNRELEGYGPLDVNGLVTRHPSAPMAGVRQGCLNCHLSSGVRGLDAWTDWAMVRYKMVQLLRMPPESDLATLLDKREMVGENALSSAEREKLAEATSRHSLHS